MDPLHAGDDVAVIPSTLAGLAVPIDELRPYPGNPRVGDVDAIAESLATNGQYRPIVVNRRTMHVLAGNHTMRAASRLGWTHIAATFVDVDDADAKRIVIADNRTGDLADWDDAALVDLLQSLDTVSGTGFDDAELARLVSSLEDDADEDRDDTGPQLGDVVYRLLIECDDERHQAGLLMRLQDEGLNVRAIAQ